NRTGQSTTMQLDVDGVAWGDSRGIAEDLTTEAGYGVATAQRGGGAQGVEPRDLGREAGRGGCEPGKRPGGHRGGGGGGGRGGASNASGGSRDGTAAKGEHIQPQASDVGREQLGRRRRRGRAQVGHQVGQRLVSLVPDRTDHRYWRREDRPGESLVV